MQEKTKQIDEKTDVLLENISESNRDFVNEKLAKLRREKRQLVELLEEAERIRYEPIDIEAVIAEAMGSVRGFQGILDQGSLEEKNPSCGRLKVESGHTPAGVGGPSSISKFLIWSGFWRGNLLSIW